MKDKKFDSFIKQSLDGQKSTVPLEMWKRIQAEKDFDPFIKENLDKHSSVVPTDLWQRITDEKDFDSNIQQKLNSHSSAVPADMWQRIRPEEKKHRPVIWWWAAAAAIILMSGIGTNWFIHHRSLPSNIAKMAPSANSSQSATTISALPNHSGGNNTSIQGHDSLSIPNANNPIIKKNPTVPDNTVSTSQHNLNILPNLSDDSIIANPNDIVVNTIRNHLSTYPNKNSINKKQLPYLTNNSFKNGQVLNQNNNQNPIISNLPIAENGNEASQNNHDLLNNNFLTNTERQLLLKGFARLSFLKNKTVLTKQLFRANAKLPTIICPPLGPPKRNDWYVEAFISPDFVQKNLTDKPSSNNIKKGMDSTLHRQVSFSAGVNIIKNLGANFLLKTGVQYAQVNELFKYNSGSDTRTTIVITTRDVIVSPGDTIHIRDTSTVQTIGTITKQTQNHYRQWDIPVIFGYEFGGSGLRLNANVGVVANIRTSYQGNMLDTSQKVIDISNYNKTGIYKTNIGLGVYLGLGILKPLNDNMDLLIEPHARFNLSNMTTNSAVFNQKNSIFGLSLGIRYKLNGGRQHY